MGTTPGYQTGDQTIADVQPDGTIIGVSPGTTMINIFDPTGAVVGTIAVTVTPAAPAGAIGGASGSSTGTAAENGAAIFKSPRESIVCRKLDWVAPSGAGGVGVGWYHFAFTAAECGGVLPDATYAGALAKTEICGKEESVMTLQPDDSFTSLPLFISAFEALKTPLPMKGPGVAFVEVEGCTRTPSFIEIVYTKKSVGESIVCKKADEIPTERGWQHFTFTAAECGGKLPDGNYAAAIAKGEVCGREQSLVALQADDVYTTLPPFIGTSAVLKRPLPMKGPGLAYVAIEPCGNGKSASGLEVLFTRKTQGESIVCRKTDAKASAVGWNHFTFTAAECGGAVPDATYVGVLGKAEICGEDESFLVLQPKERFAALPFFISTSAVLATPLPMEGPGIAYFSVSGGCGSASLIEAVYTKRAR